MKIAIIGTVGLPANYGGFETLSKHLVEYLNKEHKLTVYCSSKNYKNKIKSFNGANLKYLPFSANGFQSIIYDVISILLSFFKYDILLILGVSGAMILPFIKPFTKGKIIVNIDGIEWKRDKWNRFTRYYLRISESIAVNYSDVIIADNKEIQKYIQNKYKKESAFIPYGSNHVIKEELTMDIKNKYFLNSYCFTVCRIEPENNIHLILEAFSNIEKQIVIVGNWNNSYYGMELRRKYTRKNIILLDPIYEQKKLDELRSNCCIYIHGHSAGGTNPSLVEAMMLGLPIVAYDVAYNRATTFGTAKYFKNSKDLVNIISNISMSELELLSKNLQTVAIKNYNWAQVVEDYNKLFMICTNS